MERTTIYALLSQAQRILVAGHQRPDGDCVGACIAMYHYIRDMFPEKELVVYLETLPTKFGFLDPEGQIIQEEIPKQQYDLCIALDSSQRERLGEAETYFKTAKQTVCIDHHISNIGYAMYNEIDSTASSACEVLYGQLKEHITKDIAAALYVGILTDSGMFTFSATTKKTMEIAGILMQTGIPFWEYVDRCMRQRTYTQTQLLGRTLLTSIRLMEGKCIVASISRRMMEFYEAQTEDIDGIIDQLRITEGVEVAILLHEIQEQKYKVSMRSNSHVDVNKIASYFRGGGHKKAAGFTMEGSYHDVINNITEQIEVQMKEMI